MGWSVQIRVVSVVVIIGSLENYHRRENMEGEGMFESLDKEKKMELLYNTSLANEKNLEILMNNTDQFFLIVIGIIIFFMQCGFAFLEAGSVR